MMTGRAAGGPDPHDGEHEQGHAQGPGQRDEGRRGWWRWWALALGLAVVGCRAAAPAGEAPVATVAVTPMVTEAGPTAVVESVPAQVAIASTDLARGHERFAFSILDPAGSLLQDARAQVTFFHLDGEAASPIGTAEAPFYASSLEPAGLYVVYHDFDRAGPWGAEIAAELPDGRSILPQRVRFEVAERPQGVAVGDRPPATSNRTLATEPDLARLTSDPKPDPDLYRLTVDEAVASGRPTVVVFSTPAYCQSRICGPVLDEVKAVKATMGDTVHFIHIEVYKEFDPLVLADEMATWGLQTEPWVYVLDAEGRVAERLEGSVTAAELEPLVRRVAAGGLAPTAVVP